MNPVDRKQAIQCPCEGGIQNIEHVVSVSQSVHTSRSSSGSPGHRDAVYSGRGTVVRENTTRLVAGT